MQRRQTPRKVRDSASWCVVDLNDVRAAQVARLNSQADDFAGEIDTFDRNNIDDPLGLVANGDGSWTVRGVDANDGIVHPVTGDDKRACIVALMDAHVAADTPPPTPADQIGARLALVESYRGKLARRRELIDSVANRADKAPLHFRKAAPSRMHRAVEWSRGRRRGADLPRSAQLEAAGLLIGVTWAHELHDLEATYPRDATDHALLDFSEAVQMELADAGYVPDEMIALLNGITDDLVSPTKRDASEARKVMDFGSPPAGVTTSS